jgi:hypothetical protein
MDRMEWSVDLGAVRPERRYVVLAFAVAAGLIGLKIGGLLLCAIGFAVPLVSTLELFLPLKFRLDESGAHSKCGLGASSIQWSDVKRLLPMADGVRLSPLERPSRLDEFRGVYLRFRDNAEEVSGKIRQFWHGDTSALDRGADRAGDQRAVGQPGEPDPEAEA